MRKLCIVLILITILSAIHVNAFKYDIVREVNLDVPAVSQTSNGLIGVLSRLNVVVAYPGSGRVYFSATPLTELDTQATARIAALVSSSVLGDEYLRYDFFVSLESESLIIGGPSAGAAIAAAMMVAMLNIKGQEVTVRSNVTLTGMINPDGTIGPVGGLYAKMKAAAEKGYKVFIVPYGQSIDYVEKTIVEQRGPLRIIRTVKEKVDLVGEGEKLGVKVVEALTIYDVFKYLTGYEFKTKKYIVFMPVEVREKLKSWSISLLGEYDSLISYKYDSRLSNAVNEASKLASEARSMIDTSPYVSASRAFSALCIMYYVKYADEYLKSSNKEKYISDLIGNINKTIIEIGSILNSTIPSIKCIEAYIGAKIRYAEALEMLNNALNAMSSGAILNMYDGCLYYLAYSRQRAISARSWLEFNIAGVSVNLTTLIK
ncbi:MAG: S16 family serine protease, partial [Candidatus Methanomethylicia archaeon]